jgi:hypothetical protein
LAISKTAEDENQKKIKENLEDKLKKYLERSNKVLNIIKQTAKKIFNVSPNHN